ncbi:DUF3768 domain-containing protein [Paracoccaceae bacterium]|nr:DUF3768 domain-containing protein [Paracoccaceae bacterium]
MQTDVDRTTQSIALLNDQARTTLTNCKLIITQGIDLLGNDAVDCIFNLVKSFDDFSERNDPFGEHDFGVIRINYEDSFNQSIFWDNTVYCKG